MPIKFHSPQPIDQTALNAALKKLGITLPDEYVTLLTTVSNGGGIEPAMFAPDDNIGVAGFLGIGTKHYDLATRIAQYDGELPKGLVPIADDQSGNLICTKVSGKDTGSIWFWDHELVDDAAYKVTDSLDEFIAGFEPYKDTDLKPRGMVLYVNREFLKEQKRLGNWHPPKTTSLALDLDIMGTGEAWAPPMRGDTYVRLKACGASFSRGAFRFHDSVSGPKAATFLNDTFDFGDKLEPFAFDWLGRQYCVIDASISISGEQEAVLVDPFDMSIESLRQKDDFDRFLITPDMLELVEEPLFKQWRAAAKIESLPFDQCAGAIKSAFLGGERTVDNLELSDIEVYWAVMTQVAVAARANDDKPGDA